MTYCSRHLYSSDVCCVHVLCVVTRHGGASRLRILQEENEMKEKMFYKRRQQAPGGAPGSAADSFGAAMSASQHKKQPAHHSRHSVHEVYKRLQQSYKPAAASAIVSESPPAGSSDDIHPTLHHTHTASGSSNSTDKRAIQSLLGAHNRYTASERQQQTICAWSRGGCTESQSVVIDIQRETGVGGHGDRQGGGGGLVSYYSMSPDMLTMSDIPRYTPHYIPCHSTSPMPHNYICTVHSLPI